MEIIFCIFNKHALIRKKYTRANEARSMTKELHNAIMARSIYRNKFLKGKSQVSRENIKFREMCARNYWGKPKNRTLKALIQKQITNNRTFWQSVIPLFTKKAFKGEKIILNETETHISDNKKYVQFLITFF